MPQTKRNGFDEYKILHIPEAIFFDLDFNSKKDINLPHMLVDIDNWEEIVSKKLSSRSVELLVRQKKGVQKPGLKIDSNIVNEQKRIEETLGLKVDIKNKSNNSGSILIKYENLEQFDLIADLLKKR